VYDVSMRWLQLVGSLKLKVSFAKEPYKRDYILQKRPIVLRSLLKAIAYNQTNRSHHPICVFLKDVHLVCIRSFTSCEQHVWMHFVRHNKKNHIKISHDTLKRTCECPKHTYESVKPSYVSRMWCVV